MNQKLSKTEKLKSKILIGRLFSEGKKYYIYPIKLMYVPIEHATENGLKISVSVPKRAVPLATTRNRIKRQMREAYRKNKHLVASSNQAYACMFIFTAKKPEAYAKINYSMQRLLKKLVENENLHQKD